MAAPTAAVSNLCVLSKVEHQGDRLGSGKFADGSGFITAGPLAGAVGFFTHNADATSVWDEAAVAGAD